MSIKFLILFLLAIPLIGIPQSKDNHIQTVYHEVRIQAKNNLVYYDNWTHESIPLEIAMPFMDSIFSKILEERIEIYSTNQGSIIAPDDVISKLKIISKQKILEATHEFEYIFDYDPDTGEETNSVMMYPYEAQDVVAFGFLEDWYFDSNTGSFTKIISYWAPVVYNRNENGNVVGTKPLFFIKNDDSSIQNILTENYSCDFIIDKEVNHHWWENTLEHSTRIKLVQDLMAYALKNENKVYKLVNNQTKKTSFYDAIIDTFEMEQYDKDSENTYNKMTENPLFESIIDTLTMSEVAKIRFNETWSSNGSSISKKVSSIDFFREDYGHYFSKFRLELSKPTLTSKSFKSEYSSTKYLAQDKASKNQVFYKGNGARIKKLAELSYKKASNKEIPIESYNISSERTHSLNDDTILKDWTNLKYQFAEVDENGEPIFTDDGDFIYVYQYELPKENGFQSFSMNETWTYDSQNFTKTTISQSFQYFSNEETQLLPGVFVSRSTPKQDELIGSNIESLEKTNYLKYCHGELNYLMDQSIFNDTTTLGVKGIYYNSIPPAAMNILLKQLIKDIKAKKINAYTDNSKKTKIKSKELDAYLELNTLVKVMDIYSRISPNITKEALQPKHVESIRFVEDWYLDSSSLILSKVVKGITINVDSVFLEGKEVKTEVKPLFYVEF